MRLGGAGEVGVAVGLGEGFEDGHQRGGAGVGEVVKNHVRPLRKRMQAEGGLQEFICQFGCRPQWWVVV